MREGRSKKRVQQITVVLHRLSSDRTIAQVYRDTLPIRSKGVVGRPEFPGSTNKR